MPSQQPSLGRITLTYIGYYLGIAVVLNLILWALEYFAGVVVEANVVGWMPLILGAMMAGQRYGAKAGAKLPQGYAWMAGLVFMLVSVILSLALLYAIAVVMGLDVAATIAALQAEVGGDAGLIAGIVGGLLLLIWVGQRFMFSAGAAGVAKQAERRATKAR